MEKTAPLFDLKPYSSRRREIRPTGVRRAGTAMKPAVWMALESLKDTLDKLPEEERERRRRRASSMP